MKTFKINNQYLSATISEKGAELLELKPDFGQSVLWNMETTHWNRIAPNLFPIVGRLKQDRYTYSNAWYTLSQHGFARDSIFTVEYQSEDDLLLCLHATAETLLRYPFHFIFRIRYKLVENTLQITYETENSGSTPLYYSVGGHPAFALTDSIEKYSIRLNGPSRYTRYLLEDGLFTGEMESISNPIYLNYNLFDKDAIVLKKTDLQNCSLYHEEKKLVTIESNCEALGIWTKRNAPFVCIEPWWGFSDEKDTSQQLQNKTGIHCLNAGESEALLTIIQVHS